MKENQNMKLNEETTRLHKLRVKLGPCAQFAAHEGFSRNCP